MMFQWANKQLEKLSETLAPPPSTPSHRYLAAVASQQEDAALAILNDPHEPLDPYTSLNQKGMNALHAAASNGLVGIIRQLIGRGVRIDLADYNGWTALHHASASKSMSAQSALATVKVLVEELGASVVMKDATAQTPYDVGSSQAVRGYLLPRQLQQETQECLDNGGAGLTPGIDMGGMKINYSNVAPPPVIGTPGAPPPPSPSLTNNNDPSAALMQPPPVRGINSNFSSPIAGTKTITNATATNFGGPPGPMHQSTPVSYDNQPFIPPPINNNAGDAQQQDRPTSHLEQPAQVQTPNQQPQVQQPETPHNIAANQAVTERPPKSNNSIASSSSGYALRGGNSNPAFVLSDSKYKPDGFHTSSNDKDLQAKYGHVENSFETSRKLAMPPPPMSEGVPPPTSGGSNPYSAMGAGNMRSVGYIGGTGRARYPTYCAVSDSVSAPPSLGGTGFSPQVAPPAPSYATFNPAAVQPNPVAQGSHTQQGSTGDQYTQYSSHYTTEQSQVSPPGQTQQWSGGHQMQRYAHSNAAPAYAAQNNLSPEYGQQGYVTQHPQQSPYMQPQGAIANNSDGNATTVMGATSDAASMFATPHAEDKKDFFPTSNESTEATTVDVFSSPPPADSNATAAIMQQQQATGNDSLPAEQNDMTPDNNNVAAKFEAPAENTPPPVVQSVSNTQPSTSQPNANNGASIQNGWQGEVNNEAAANATSFFGASESTATVKSFGGLPPPPVVGSNGINSSLATANTMVGSSSLPPPPTMKSFPNQAANTPVSAEDEVPNFSDISLTE